MQRQGARLAQTSGRRVPGSSAGRLDRPNAQQSAVQTATDIDGRPCPLTTPNTTQQVAYTPCNELDPATESNGSHAADKQAVSVLMAHDGHHPDVIPSRGLVSSQRIAGSQAADKQALADHTAHFASPGDIGSHRATPCSSLDGDRAAVSSQDEDSDSCDIPVVSNITALEVSGVDVRDAEANPPGQAHISISNIDFDMVHRNNSELLSVFKEVWRSGQFNHLCAKVPLLSNMKVQRWRQLLQSYPDKHIVDFIEFGWPIGIDRTAPLVSETNNHPSARDYPRDVEHYIATELGHAAMLGPFGGTTAIPCQFSPLMTRPKKGSIFRRVIIDLSWPRGASVNDAISRTEYIDGPMTISLPTIDDMERAVVRAGRDSYLYKTDLSRGYRQLRVDPLDWPYLAFRFNGMQFIDICPSFGLRSSAMAMQRVSQALVYLHANRGFSSHAYIDDFGGVEPELERANEALGQLQDIMEDLGVQQAEAKICLPSHVMIWLGIEFDTVRMLMTIPPVKLAEIMQFVQDWGGRTRATRRDIQSLLGLLNFVAGVAPPARLFTNRILDCLREAPRTGSVTLSLQFKQDVRFFADLLPIFVGRKVMGKCILPYQHQVELDACLTGCGAVAGDQFYATPFPQYVLYGGHSIAHLEMLNVVVAVKMWRERWSGWTVQIYCDNANTVALLQSGKSRDDFMRACAREIFLYAAAFDIDVQACHRPGVQMVWADALSREHTHDKFRRFVREDQHLSSARRLEVPPGLFGLVNTL